MPCTGGAAAVGMRRIWSLPETIWLDSGGDSYLTRIFNRRNVVQIDRLDRLPERLPMIYLRPTA